MVIKGDMRMFSSRRPQESRTLDGSISADALRQLGQRGFSPDQVPVFDLAIVGLGPAGSTLARLLAPHLSVAAVDQKHLDDWRTPEAGGPGNGGFRKPCGGLLSPDAQKALSRFQLTLPKELLASPQIFSVRTLDLPSGITRHYQRFYLNMDRHRFDLWLASLIPACASVFDRSRCDGLWKLEPGRLEQLPEGGYLLSIRREGESRWLLSRSLAGADGANSLVRRRFFSQPIRRYLSIQQWFPQQESPPEYLSVFDERLTDCYAWCSAKDGYAVLGAALPLQGARAAFEQLKERLSRAGFAFAAHPPVKTEACLVNRPASLRELALADGEGSFLLGEAAGWISPSSLEGISYGFSSALALANAFLSPACGSLSASRIGAAYEKNVRPLRRKLAGKLFKTPVLYTPALRRMVMRSGLAAIKPLNETGKGR